MDPLANEPALWAAFRSLGDVSAREQLFFKYAPWARSVARDVYRRVPIPQMDWSDYVHNATVGLLEAMSRFDVARGIDFIAYAKPRVRGAVFNGLRSYLSESSRRESYEDRFRERLESFDSGEFEDPLSQMIASVTGLGLGFLLESGAAADGARSSSDASGLAERHELEVLLDVSLAKLSEKERRVLTLHYYQHLPFVEIAGLLGLTKGRISQLHKAAIQKCAVLLREQGLASLTA